MGLCWAFLAVSRASPVVVHRLILLQSTGSRACGLSTLTPTKDHTHIPCIARQILNHWTTREVLKCLLF